MNPEDLKEDDIITVACITVEMGRQNPSRVVRGATIKKCHNCKTDIYVSPATMEFIKTKTNVSLLCNTCTTKGLKEQEKKKVEVKFMGLVPGGIHEAKKHFKKLSDKMIGLPVYDWYDDHGKNEWVCIGTNDEIWYMCGDEKHKSLLKLENLVIKDGLLESIKG